MRIHEYTHIHARTYDDGEYRKYMHANCVTGTETNAPRTSLSCSPRYGNSTRRWFAEALGANHPLVHYPSGSGSAGYAASATTPLIPYYLTRENGTRIHPYVVFKEKSERMFCLVSLHGDYGGFLPYMMLLTQCFYHRGTVPYIIGHSMEISTELHGSPWRLHAGIEVHGGLHGASTGPPWSLHRPPWKPPRSLHAPPWRPPWRPPRSLHEPPRSLHGASTYHHGGLHGASTEPPWTSMEPPRTSTETSTEPPRSLHGAPWRLPWNPR